MSLSWSIPELLSYKAKGLNFDEEVVLPLELFRSDPEVRRLSPCEVKGAVEFAKRSLTFHLQIKGTMVLPCALTLADVPYPFSIDTSELFLLNGSKADSETDDFVHSVENDRIDLIPYLVEAILVEKPMRVISEQAAAEQELSGKGWSLMNGEQAKQKIDPRLEKLKNFFND
ncbi:MAG: YceD family protein [Sporolactobacillus sp.]